MIPFYLVTGFLGSGKTTLLQNILHKYSESLRIAVIQNEFAPAGTDGKELKRAGLPFKLVEVNNGSVFCVCMLGTFIQSLEKLVNEYNPEMIFLEASGLADPINIIELLQDTKIKDKLSLARIFSIVDAPNFERGLQRIGRFRHQVMIADEVIVNKTDLYKGDLRNLHEKIREMNPFARIIDSDFCKFDLDSSIFSYENEHKAAKAFGRKDSEDRPDINACVLRIHNKISLEKLKSFVNELQKESPRIKGYVNTTDGKMYSLQSVFDRFEYKAIENYMAPTEIVAFGENISPGLLRKRFLQYTGQ